MYKNYIFDLYGTLVDIRTDEGKEELWNKMSLLYGYSGAIYSADELCAEYHNFVEIEKSRVASEHPNYSYIDIKVENVFEKLYNHKGVSVSKEQVLYTASAFRCFSTEFVKLYDGVVDLLDILKTKGKKIYLLSNAQRSFTENELNMLGIAEYFDGICISSDVECSKPDSNYFQHLFTRYNLNKSESIMIGNDCNSDIEGACGFGIDSLYIHQSISPEIVYPLKSNYTILDGDVYKIKKLIVDDL